jgi:hypothetical protein
MSLQEEITFFTTYEIEWEDAWEDSWGCWSSHCTSIVSFDDSWSNAYKEDEKNFEEECTEERKRILLFNLLEDMGDDDLDDIGGPMLKKFTGDLPEEYMRELEKKQK